MEHSREFYGVMGEKNEKTVAFDKVYDCFFFNIYVDIKAEGNFLVLENESSEIFYEF